MDLLFGHDRKLDYLDEPDMVDFLDTDDIFNTPLTGFPTPEEEGYEHDWLNSILDTPVLNDRMMTDAMQPPCIKAEHSYSISEAASPLGALSGHDDLDSDLFTASQSALDLTVKSSAASPAMRALKFESTATNTPGSSASAGATGTSSRSSSPTPSLSTSSSASTSTLHHHHQQQQQHYHNNHHHQQQHQLQHHHNSTSSSTVSISGSRHQPTIIVTTTSAAAASSGGYSLCNGDGSSSSGNSSGGSGSSMLSFPTIQIKQEAAESMELEQKVNLESMMMMPLTPPGSSGSDSEGGSSPNRSAPGSPDARQSLSIGASSRHTATVTSVSSPGSPMTASSFSQPLFVSPISQSGVLILSEEEKRTLISEGYTIPSKLPLTKQEEKNLKKIRRKIKNKISAQESRRKKKEYLEALEKRVEAYNHENCDLKKKVESLENNNRSLLGQLQKLQSLVSKVNKANATQTGTALMVLVFCFAVFLGSLSPSNLNIGYQTKPAQLPFVAPPPASSPSQQDGHHHHHHGYYYAHFAEQHGAPRQDVNDIGPKMATAQDTSSPYDTPSLKSRMLMSVDQDDYCDDYRPVPWQSALQSCPTAEQQQHEQEPVVEMEYQEMEDDVEMNFLNKGDVPSVTEVPPPTVVVLAPGAELNATDGEGGEVRAELELGAEFIAGIAHHNVSAEFGTV